VAAAGGCRKEVEVDDGGDWSRCVDAAKSVARLSDIRPPLCMLLSGGPARPLGYLRAETPLEENPQALPHRARPGRPASVSVHRPIPAVGVRPPKSSVPVDVVGPLSHTKQRWRRQPKSTKFYSTTKFPTMHSLSAKTHGNSNYYGQLKSIDNYSRSTTIATAIRNGSSV